MSWIDYDYLDFVNLKDGKLDGFGMAISVIAACQILDLNDVHLALSEDHAWAVYGDPSSLESAEITWHGKGCEDKRGQAIVVGSEKGWLYAAPIICSRQMEVAAMVTAINCAINATTDSGDLAVLQQKLFWLLYDMSHLSKYPAALATLADMETVTVTEGRTPSSALYAQAIESAKLHYDDLHVYPYTYSGNYHYRCANYKEALRSWAKAADVISRFNYNREDEEIYKEFLEIANELIPNIMKTVSGEQAASGDPLTVVSTFASDVPLVSDPECYAFILQFYDGLCLWEEGSSTPVLHITWATHALYSLNRFDMRARSNLMLKEDPVSDQIRIKEDSTSSNFRITKPKRALDDSVVKQKNKSSKSFSSAEADIEDAERHGSTSGEHDAGHMMDASKETEKLCIILHSAKMIGMKDLLVAERLNSGAIKLQLTAQSQVQFKQTRNSTALATDMLSTENLSAPEGTRKRSKRE